jgi:ethylbenzene dioxygenase beta subunit
VSIDATSTATDEVELTLRLHIVDLLHREAELLDDGRLHEWMDLLTDDIVYQVPVRVHKEVTGDTRVTGVQNRSFHMDETRASLELRVDRVDTGFAWAEEPPSRLRHHISNVRVRPGTTDGELSVRSNVLIYRSRWDRPEHDLLSCERFDTFRSVDSAWKLARRWVVLDSTSVPTHNLSFFF